MEDRLILTTHIDTFKYVVHIYVTTRTLNGLKSPVRVNLIVTKAML